MDDLGVQYPHVKKSPQSGKGSIKVLQIISSFLSKKKKNIETCKMQQLPVSSNWVVSNPRAKICFYSFQAIETKDFSDVPAQMDPVNMFRLIRSSRSLQPHSRLSAGANKDSCALEGFCWLLGKQNL